VNDDTTVVRPRPNNASSLSLYKHAGKLNVIVYL